METEIAKELREDVNDRRTKFLEGKAIFAVYPLLIVSIVLGFVFTDVFSLAEMNAFAVFMCVSTAFYLVQRKTWKSLDAVHDSFDLVLDKIKRIKKIDSVGWWVSLSVIPICIIVDGLLDNDSAEGAWHEWLLLPLLLLLAAIIYASYKYFYQEQLKNKYDDLIDRLLSQTKA